MPEAAQIRHVEAVLRSLATAARSLRLYPPASPIPLQSVQTVKDALTAFFEDGPETLCISLAREGFAVDGATLGAQIPGARDLSDDLRAHGIADIQILSAISPAELLDFLMIIDRPVDEVRDEGGVGELSRAAGIENIQVTEVRLSVIDAAYVADTDEAEAYLMGLSEDPGGLAAWYSAAVAGEPGTFERDLITMAKSAGHEGTPRLVSSLGTAFKSQPPAGQDALLGLAMKPGPVRDLVGELFENFSAPDIAGSILSGAFGKNMLALSHALDSLPLDSIAAEVRAELEEMLPRAGHTAEEAGFLDHMLEVRARRTLEQPLVLTDTTYNAVLSASTLSDDDVARACAAVSASRQDMNGAGVRAMLTLLDEQTDFERYCRSAENLAGIVPHLIEQGDLKLASSVLSELSRRQSDNTGPWPELSGRLESAMGMGAGTRSMHALVKAVVADPTLLEDARGIVRFAGDAGGTPLVAEAIALKESGIAVAEKLLGRRVIDLLNAAAPDTQWHLLGPIVQRLATEGDAHSMATIAALMERPDEQSRREIVNALSCVANPDANRLLAGALRDKRPETASVAARAIARSGEPGSAELLSARLSELDMDHGDFLLAKELIGALARTPGPAADEALAKLAARRTFIKRGHFSDIQALVAEARRARKGGTAR